MVSAVKVRLRKGLGDLCYALRGRTTAGAGRSLTILMYHAVTKGVAPPDYDQVCVSTELFRRQMGWLRELKYPVVALQEATRRLRNGSLRSSIVSITFDDGYLNTYTDAFPILAEYGYPATVFLVPGAMETGGSSSFMLRQCGPPMGWHHAREMAKSGISFGSHSMTHRVLSRLSDEELEWEITGSKKVIEDELSVPVSEFCYPYGWFESFNSRAEAAVRRAEFTAICTGIAGQNFSADDVLRLKRLRVSWLDDSLAEIRKQCLGCYNWYSIRQRWVSAVR